MTLPAWASPDELKPAPEPLLLVQAFVNTRDQSLGTDLLADADAARQWLRQCGLLAAEATVGADDLRAARDVPEGMARLLLIIRDAQRDGTWPRLKACSNSDCHWAFYDRSHSRRGAWCDMASCGNVIKNRNLRARRSRQRQPTA